MATIKHIASKNADYGAAEQYLTYDHDGFTMKPVLDGDGLPIPRDDYRIETVNCSGEDFAVACLRANMRYGKNNRREDVKSHHYIISFDPRDAADNGLTMDRAQELGLAYCKAHFPGHQALVCTHPDGHNHSGNIHVHIVINSLRIADVERKPYMDRLCDTKAGAKHRCTGAAMRYFRSEVMEMCHREGLDQIDLLGGSREKVTEREYWAKQRGQEKLDRLVEKMKADHVTPRTTKFETEKEKLRGNIRTVLASAVSFEDFSRKLMEGYGIAVKESRGRYSYLTPDRTKPITARKLGTDFDKAAALAAFADNVKKREMEQQRQIAIARTVQDGQAIPEENDARQVQPASVLERLRRAEGNVRRREQEKLQRMVDIPAKVAEGKGKGYEQWAKKFNLRQMAGTMNLFAEYGFTSMEDVEAALTGSIRKQNEASREIKEIEKKIADNRETIRQIGVYKRTKPVYEGLKKARRPERYREKNRPDLALFDAAGRHFKAMGLTKLPSAQKLQEENEALISRKNALYNDYRAQKGQTEKLRRVKENLEGMLRAQPEAVKKRGEQQR